MNSPVFSTSHDTSEPFDREGWIDWTGGSCPVPGASVAVRLRDGRTTFSSQSDVFRWEHNGHRGDIVAFRCLPAAAAEHPTARPEGEHRISYDAIKAIVSDCRERMQTAGESTEMFAKWVSEGLNARLADTPTDADLARIRAEAAEDERQAVREIVRGAICGGEKAAYDRGWDAACCQIDRAIDDRARQRAAAKAEADTRERLAKAIYAADGFNDPWEDLRPNQRELYFIRSDAVRSDTDLCRALGQTATDGAGR